MTDHECPTCGGSGRLPSSFNNGYPMWATVGPVTVDGRTVPTELAPENIVGTEWVSFTHFAPAPEPADLDAVLREATESAVRTSGAENGRAVAAFADQARVEFLPKWGRPGHLGYEPGVSVWLRCRFDG